MTEPRPVPASRAEESAEFDARFALARGRLVRICRAFVGADAAEDVVQDTYLRGRSRWRDLRDDDLFEAWLTRIAINLCIDRNRAGQRLRDLSPFLARGAQPSAGRDVGLRQLVEQLPPRERTLV